MASVGQIEIPIMFSVDEKTMRTILNLLDVWQAANPGKMVAMVPAKDRYQYEIIEMEKKHEID